MGAIELAERGWLPDWLVRIGIRQLLAKRLRKQNVNDAELAGSEQAKLIDVLKQSPLAVDTDAANEQHYEVPAAFFEACLGPRLKYSCCLFDSPDDTLATAEEKMLQLTCQRAELTDGIDILELGCGWGSLTIWMAEHYPNARIVAVSNSNGQREYIERQLAKKDLSNARVITCNMQTFKAEQSFDRVVSVEMFEHMRNYELLFERISSWLKPSGKLFVHIFCHRVLSYLFETDGDGDWMARHFFTGGIMPSRDLYSHFQRDDLKLASQWDVNGNHYWKTSEAWLVNLDRQRATLEQQLREPADGHELPKDFDLKLFLERWRIFFLACAELFRYQGGEEWFVSHYLFERR